MQPKKPPSRSQAEIFRARLENQLDHHHALYQLAGRIDWKSFNESFGKYFHPKRGRPGIPTRIMVGLHYLKHTYNESDESVVARWVENPYWQFFCGCEFFQHQLPINPSTMSRWRRRVGKKGLELLLQQTIAVAKNAGSLRKSDLQRVNVDTTVQEKAIAFPTDARLYDKARRKLVQAAKQRGVILRQSYTRVGQRALQKQSRYAHARQYKRAQRMTRKLRTLLGRVIRDVQRKVEKPDHELAHLLGLATRLHQQKRTDKGKLYSLWAPEVECISKGKAHQRYEFGCKVGVVTTSKKSWVVGVQAFHGNPYDGHTLKRSLAQAQELTGYELAHVFVDRGYRGTNKTVSNYEIHLPGSGRKNRSLKRWLRRRSAIEPVIGHLKSDHRMKRNHLHGKDGDIINALLSGCGFNLRKLLREVLGRRSGRFFSQILLYLLPHHDVSAGLDWALTVA